jgi:hypothetical protein
MPYTARKVGDQYCVYKKDGGEKVGCTDGNKEALRKYLAALHLNANESVNELTINSVGVRELLRKIFRDPKLMDQLNFKTFRRAVEFVRTADIEDFNQLEQEVEAYEQGKLQEQVRKLVREHMQKVISVRSNQNKK